MNTKITAKKVKKHEEGLKDLLNEFLGDDLTSGKVIKGLRKNRLWTQETLGEIVDIAPESISKYEKGTINLSYETAEKFAAAFHTTPESIFRPMGVLRGEVFDEIRERAKRQITA